MGSVHMKLGLVMHTWNPSPQKVEAGESEVLGHPLHSEFKASLGYMTLCLDKRGKKRKRRRGGEERGRSRRRGKRSRKGRRGEENDQQKIRKKSEESEEK